MSALGDISLRQQELRSKLMGFRNRANRDNSGFGESKENFVPNSNIRVKKSSVDSMAKLLQNQLDSSLDQEKRDELARKEEKEELEKLRAEVKLRALEKERLAANNSKMERLQASQSKTKAQLDMAMEHINELTFEKSIIEQQLKEWKNKISIHTSNVKEMQIVRQREKDLLYRARKDREREVKILKEGFEAEKKAMLREKRDYEEKSEQAVSNMAAQMQRLQVMAMDKIAQLENEI
jgi:hypothetical protein